MTTSSPVHPVPADLALLFLVPVAASYFTTLTLPGLSLSHQQPPRPLCPVPTIVGTLMTLVATTCESPH